MEGIGISIMPEIAVKKEIAQARVAAAKLTDGPFEVATLMIS